MNAFNPDDQNMWTADSIFGTARTDVPAYVDFLEGAAQGRGLPAGWVPSDTYWAFAGDEMGEIHVRHSVRGTLWRIGGHVGYAVQPKFRGQGVAIEKCGGVRIVDAIDAGHKARRYLIPLQP